MVEKVGRAAAPSLPSSAAAPSGGPLNTTTHGKLSGRTLICRLMPDDYIQTLHLYHILHCLDPSKADVIASGCNLLLLCLSVGGVVNSGLYLESWTKIKCNNLIFFFQKTASVCNLLVSPPPRVCMETQSTEAVGRRSTQDQHQAGGFCALMGEESAACDITRADLCPTASSLTTLDSKLCRKTFGSKRLRENWYCEFHQILWISNYKIRPQVPELSKMKTNCQKHRSWNNPPLPFLMTVVKGLYVTSTILLQFSVWTLILRTATPEMLLLAAFCKLTQTIWQ